MEDTENNEEARCKDSSGIDTWVKVLAISLIILVLLFGVGIIAWMARGDAVATTSNSGNKRTTTLEQVGVISSSSALIFGPTNGEDYRISLEKTGRPASFRLTWKNAGGGMIRTKEYSPGEYTVTKDWVVAATNTITAELVNPTDDPISVKFAVLAPINK